MNDARLNLANEKGKLVFQRPLDSTGQVDEDYFNLLVIHQNRFKGLAAGVPRNQSLTDEFFPDFIDLVVWGHEHECKTEAQEVAANDVHILQPGSTVATSLIKAESDPKHMFQVKIANRSFKISPIPLQN